MTWKHLKTKGFMVNPFLSLRDRSKFCEGEGTLTVFPNSVRFDSGFSEESF